MHEGRSNFPAMYEHYILPGGIVVKITRFTEEVDNVLHNVQRFNHSQDLSRYTCEWQQI